MGAVFFAREKAQTGYLAVLRVVMGGRTAFDQGIRSDHTGAAHDDYPDGRKGKPAGYRLGQ